MTDKERGRVARLEQRRAGSTQQFTRREQVLRRGLLAKVNGRQLPPEEQALYERYQEEDRKAYEKWWGKISPACQRHIELVHSWSLARIRGEEPEGPVPEGLHSEPRPGCPPGPGWPRSAYP